MIVLKHSRSVSSLNSSTTKPNQLVHVVISNYVVPIPGPFTEYSASECCCEVECCSVMTLALCTIVVALWVVWGQIAYHRQSWSVPLDFHIHSCRCTSRVDLHRSLKRYRIHPLPLMVAPSPSPTGSYRCHVWKRGKIVAQKDHIAAYE